MPACRMSWQSTCTAQGRLVGFRGLEVRAWQPQRHLNGRQSRHTSASSFADISTELQKASCLQISQRKSSAGEVPGRQGMTWQLQHTPAPSFAHKFILLHKASCLPISQWGSEAGEAAGKQGMKREKCMVVEMTTCQNARLLPHPQRPPPRRTPRSIRRCLQLSGWHFPAFRGKAKHRYTLKPSHSAGSLAWLKAGKLQQHS